MATTVNMTNSGGLNNTKYNIRKNSLNTNNNNNSNNNNNNNNNNTNLTNLNMIEYSLADVYDDAAIIGSELEKIINNYGSDVLKDLMPKVISVLELLECLTLKKEKENDEINELKMKINSLELEKATRLNERDKFEKELEEIEEKWKQETLKLIGMVNKLKEENKRLNESLDQNQNSLIIKNDQLIIKQEELDYIRQIKEENLKLKEQIRYKEREMELKNNENESLVNQIENLTQTMLNLRRKQILAQNQIEKMVKSKAEIECQLTDKEHQINVLKEKLKIKTDSDLEENNQKKLNDVNTKQNQNQIEPNELTNLLIYDPNDPNRPRFTLKELQKVLREKNELTIKLDQTQDELEQLKRQETITGEVQGPINREPEEKLDPSSKQPSGIRRFFSFFLSSINNSIVVANDENSASNVSTENTSSSTTSATTNVFIA